MNIISHKADISIIDLTFAIGNPKPLLSFTHLCNHCAKYEHIILKNIRVVSATRRKQGLSMFDLDLFLKGYIGIPNYSLLSRNVKQVLWQI